jgi:flagellum-specific ATP synthase
VLTSVSRLMTEVASPEHQALAAQIKKLTATYRDAEDLINIGAYVQGSNPEIDRAIHYRAPALGFLQQTLSEGCTLESTVEHLNAILRPPVEGEMNAEV